MTALTANPFSMSPLHTGTPGPARPPIETSNQRDFAEILGIANRMSQPTETDPQTRARQAAEQFVAQVLVQPMLAEVRNASTQPPPFGPGNAEKQFGSIIDAQRAMDMVRGSGWSIVDRVAADLERAERNTDNRSSGDPADTEKPDEISARPGWNASFAPDTRRMSSHAGS